MDTTTFANTLQPLIAGVWYISESENPFTFEDMGRITNEAVLKEIAAENNAPAEEIKRVAPDVFFEKIERTADPADALIVKNASRIKTMYNWLKENLTNIEVYRVESGVRVPVYITGFLPDGNCVAIKTFSIES